MKKIICSAFAVLLISVSFLFLCGDASAATDDNGICLFFVADDVSLAGCTQNMSPFDTVLDRVLTSGSKTAFFFDVEDYNENYACALLKLIAANVPFGAVANSSDDALEAIKYEKYASKTVSRLLLFGPDAEKAGDEFCAVTYDIMLETEAELGYGHVSNFSGANIAIVINAETARAVGSLLSDIRSDDMYIITPTQYGFVLYGKEE